MTNREDFSTQIGSMPSKEEEDVIDVVASMPKEEDSIVTEIGANSNTFEVLKDNHDDNNNNNDDIGVVEKLKEKDEDITSYDGITIKQSDLDSLQGQNYLSDNVIGFYFSYLSSRFQSEDIFLVSPSLSFLLATLSPSDESYNALVDSLKLSEKQVLIFTVNDGEGIHWSLLVYHKETNTFIHHDSIKGQHESHAYRFYNKIKRFVGPPDIVRVKITRRCMKKMKKNKNASIAIYKREFLHFVAHDPLFTDEIFTPQQTNSYDCGLYVMEIARVICEWYLNGSRNRDELWFSDLEMINTCSIQSKMRDQVQQLIEDLRNGRLAAPPCTG